MHHKKIFAVLPALLVCSAWGQVAPPSGGVLRQQLDPPHLPTLPELEPRLTAPPPAAPASAAGPRVVVRTFEFSGQTLLDTDRLQAAVAPWRGRSLGFSELAGAAQAVAEAYRQAGWLARADLPPQDVTDGVVRIRITEARFAGVVPDGAATRRVQPAQATAIVTAAQPAGQPLNLDALDHALLLINDLPGTTATLSLRAGTREGDTQAALALADTPAWSGSASADNEGARATGAARESVQLSANSPLGIGDLAALQASHSRGSDYLRLAYDAPVGALGWRVGINGSALHYKVVAPEFSALGAQGPSQSVGLQATAPLLRTRSANIYLQLTADHRHFRNEADGSVSSKYDIESLSASLSGNRLDDWAGGGASTGSVELTGGDVALWGSPNEAADAATTRTAGDYTKLHASAGRQQRLGAATTLVVNAQAQWASRNLDGAEKFYLGGPNAVRAYPVDEAGGSLGQLLSVELQRAFAVGSVPASVAAFADAGHISINEDNSYAGAPARNGYTLKGAGAWASTTLPASLASTQLRATWARRIGGNPGATAAGRDQDGSRTVNRFWLSASASF